MLRAARSLTAALASGGVAVMSTGIVMPNVMPVGESDGPPGLLVLASMLARTLGVTTVLVAEPETHPSLAVGAAILGLPVHDSELRRTRTCPSRATEPAAAEDTPGIVIVDFPIDASPAAAGDFLDRWGPRAVVVAEKLGLNSVGVPHTSTGKRLAGPRIPFELIVDSARARAIPTVAVGDGGNEIGFGLIHAAVKQHKPFGRVCQCGCGAGLACVNACDHLIVATVSNWGCYGLATMIAGLLKAAEMLPTGQDLGQLLEAIAYLGVIDGATGQATPTVDGIEGHVETSILDIMGTAVRMALTRRPARTF